MPSELMDQKGLSPSSFFSEEVHFPNERQVGFWKAETAPDHHYGMKADGKFRTVGDNSVASSPMEKQMSLTSHMAKGFDVPNSYMIQDQKIPLGLEKHVMGAGRAVSRSWQRPLAHDRGSRSNVNMEHTSYFMTGDNVMSDQYENSLFSSSLSELFSRKMRLSSNNTLYGHSVGAAASHYEQEEPFESLAELEAHTIGNLLPHDDDLLSGVTDGLDYTVQLSSGDDAEDLDFFSSVGGMDLGEDGTSSGQRNSDISGGNSNVQLGASSGSPAGEHPYGEHPSRTLFVRNINSNVEDSELRVLFEQYGDIRTLYTACKHRGFVMISYYDIRSARNAMKALQNKPLRRRKLDIHFSIPKDNPSDKDVNQGTLVVFNLDSSVSNEELLQIFGVYGEIKEIRETPHRSHHKFVEFYDVRAADAALRALNRSDIAGKRIKLEPSRPGGNRRLMQAFPELDADESAALLQMCGSPTDLMTGISGMDPVGRNASVGFENGTTMAAQSTTGAAIGQLVDVEFHHGISSSVPNHLPSIVRMESVGKPSSVTESIQSLGQMKLDFHGTPNFHPHSLPEYHDGLANNAFCNSPGNVVGNISSRPSERVDNRQFCRVGSNGHSLELNENVFGPSGNASCPPPAQHYMWSNSHHPQPHGMIWPNSPSYVNGVGNAHTTRLHPLPRAPPHMMNTLVPMNSHHVGSAPSVNPSLWDRRNAYGGESPDASVYHPGSLGNMRMSGNSPHPLEFVSHNMFPRVGGNCMDLPVPSKSVGLPSHHQSVMFPSRGQLVPMMTQFDSPNDRARNRRNEGSSNHTDNKKQFELDLDRIMRGEDRRTTLMIKNIPNKYTSKMLLAAIDERHRGTYDFIYLPIDFKNKCNVGYAFINMTEPSLIVPFYQAFNGKKWEKFNSEKVASLAYARIQGKAALIAHFQNSSLMNEDKRCRPILFHTDGPNAGDQVPFPMGVNVRSRPNKNRASTSEENQLESPQELPNGDDYSNGDSSSGSGKDFD